MSVQSWGYSDLAGEPQLGISAKDAFAFLGGCAAVRDDAGYGLIDRSGRFAFPRRFSNLAVCREGTCVAADDTGSFFVDFAGKPIGPKYDEIRVDASGPFAAARTGNIWRFVDYFGTPAFASIYLDVALFRGGLASVKYEAGPAVIDLSGNPVYRPDGFIVGPYSHGLAPAWRSRRGKRAEFGFVDRSGAFAIPPSFDDCYGFAEGLSAVRKNGKYGFIDTAGETVIPFALDLTHYFSEGVAAAEIDEKWGFIGHSGAWTISPRYDFVDAFRKGLAVVKLDGMANVVNLRGDELLPWRFASIRGYSEGLLPVRFF